MTKSIRLQGKLAFPSMVTANEYSGKLQFNLTWPAALTAKIEDSLRSIVDEDKGKGYYDAIKHKKIKSGKEMVAKGYNNFEGRDHMVIKQDGYGWQLVDLAGNEIEPEEFGMDDSVRVVLTIGYSKTETYGKAVFLNPKVIQLVKSAGNSKGSYSLEGDALGEVIEADKLTVADTTDATIASDGEDLF